MHKIIKLLKAKTKELLKTKKYNNLVEKLKLFEIFNDMQLTNTKMNLREIYYNAPKLFKSQLRTHSFIKSICKDFKITESELNIKLPTKGIFYGKLKFYNTMNKTEIIRHGLIPNMEDVYKIESNHKYIIVIEKESMMSFITQIPISDDILFVSGKGYPCRNTILFLKKLENQNLKMNKNCVKKIKIFGFFDLDPHGLNIYKIYKKGSIKNPHEISMTRLGLNSKDVYKYKINENDLIDLSDNDLKLLERLLSYEIDDDFYMDILFLKGLGKKMEMEILINRDKNFFISYLYSKLNI